MPSRDDARASAERELLHAKGLTRCRPHRTQTAHAILDRHSAWDSKGVRPSVTHFLQRLRQVPSGA